MEIHKINSYIQDFLFELFFVVDLFTIYGF
jgi:hypothetical protein